MITACIAAAVALDLRKRLTGADIALLWLACVPGSWSDIAYGSPISSVAPIIALISVFLLTVFRWRSVGAIELAVYWFGCAILNLLPAIFKGPNAITEGPNVWEAVLVAVVATCFFGLWWALQQSKGKRRKPFKLQFSRDLFDSVCSSVKGVMHHGIGDGRKRGDAENFGHQ